MRETDERRRTWLGLLSQRLPTFSLVCLPLYWYSANLFHEHFIEGFYRVSVEEAVRADTVENHLLFLPFDVV